MEGHFVWSVIKNMENTNKLCKKCKEITIKDLEGLEAELVERDNLDKWRIEVNVSEISNKISKLIKKYKG